MKEAKNSTTSAIRVRDTPVTLRDAWGSWDAMGSECLVGETTQVPPDYRWSSIVQHLTLPPDLMNSPRSTGTGR